MKNGKPNRVLVAGATGYLGKFAVQAFKNNGYWVRVLTRSTERLYRSGPFTAPAISKDEVDDMTLDEIQELLDQD